jgi:hypothetical protein
MAALGAFNHTALNEGWTTRTSESSAVGNIKDKSAFRTMHYMFFLGSQVVAPPCKTYTKMIKTFLIHDVETKNCLITLWNITSTRSRERDV